MIERMLCMQSLAGQMEEEVEEEEDWCWCWWGWGWGCDLDQQDPRCLAART